MYAFLTVFALYILVVKNNFVVFTLTLIALFYTHYLSALYIPILLLIMFIKAYISKYSLKKLTALVLVFAIPTAFLFFNSFLSSKTRQENNWAGPASLQRTISSLASYAFGVKTKLLGASVVNDFNLPLDKNVLIVGFVLLFFTAALLAYIKLIKQKNYTNTIWLTAIISFVILPQIELIAGSAVLRESIYVERYLIPSCIFFAIAAAIVLRTLVRTEFSIIVVVAYCLLISQIQPHRYYTGMKQIAQKYKDYTGEIVFTSPVDYSVGRYYLPKTSVKLYDPKQPNETFTWWWFITTEARPTWPHETITFSPDENRMTSQFSKVENTNFGDYKVFIKN
jgi:hypothetical protein